MWIIHRDAQQRAALARIAGAGDSTYLGAPSDELFASASPADVVLLAPSGDFESELEFVHRFSPQFPKCTWILLPAARDLAETQRLFDNLPATFLRFPPQPDRLRKCIAMAENRRSADSLSRRRGRDLLAARFSRWFIDLDLPDLLRALDPRLAHLPLLIRGEVGTGRGLVARYVHAFGSSDFAELLHVPCSGIESERELLDLIGAANSSDGDWQRTIWLEDVDRLPTALQLHVRDWIEYGLPESVLRTTRVRFIASAEGEDEYDWELDEDPSLPRLNRSLATALSGLLIALPPLRERAERIGTFVADTALAWATSQGERHRSFGDSALRELIGYPWPGNMAQLEAVVYRSLTHSSANPLEPHHLRFQSDAPITAEAALPMAEFVDDPLPGDPLPSPEPHPLPEPPIAQPEVSEQRSAVTHAEPHAEPQVERSAAEPAHPQTELDAPEPVGSEAERVPAPPPQPREAEPAAPGFGETDLRRLVGALAHEVRNPLVSIRTFAELLPDHYSDQDFRDRFAELVGADVRQIESVVSRLQDLSELAPARQEPIDLPVMLDRILDHQSELIQERHLLVLKELDHNQPFVLADGGQLERAFSGLIETALSMVPERGDVYLASKHHSQGLAGRPSVRILFRYHNPSIGRPLSDILAEDGFPIEGITPQETSLEFLIVEAIVGAQGGSMTVDDTDGQETVIVVDLPAAPGSAPQAR